MERRPTTQDVSWMLDLRKNNQINLSPPYQRRSVWTPKDKRFFLDTIFRNYPSPAIFLHKHYTPDGAVTYDVVDGKQRLETIFAFASNNLRMPTDFGDERLNGKRWSDIVSFHDLKLQFWNYQLSVELIGLPETATVNNVFDRLNRNSRRLTQQEMRHARHEGWFITTAENETEVPFWREIGVSTRTRTNRMMDVQFISELMAVILRDKIDGFDHEILDDLYAEYDDISEVENFNEDDFIERMHRARATLMEMERTNNAITLGTKGSVGSIYTLWSVIVLTPDLAPAGDLAHKYLAFMNALNKTSPSPTAQTIQDDEYVQLLHDYRENARGASTEHTQRLMRFSALQKALVRP